jgi:membrane-bound serine protease (ClpP class)
LRRLAISTLTLMAGLTLFGPPARAQSNDTVPPTTPAATVTNADIPADVGRVDVLQVSGFIDPILVDSIGKAIDRAVADKSQALILQVNSDATVVDDATVGDLLVRVANAEIPIGIWVGPSGARFYGTAAQLLAVADVTGMAPGSRVGYIGVPLDPPGLPEGVSVDFGIAEDRLRNGSVGLSDARTLNVFKQRVNDEGIPTISNMMQAMDGYEENGVIVVTTKLVVLDDGSTRFDTVSVVRFSKLTLLDQLFHTVASPPVAYLLLLIGLALLIFEFFTAGVGLAGGIGAIATVLAFSGLAVLPTQPWAVALIMLAMLAFAVDVQVGIPRFWTGVGIVLTIVGSWYLFEPVAGSSMRPSWLALIAGIGGIILTFVVGMPSMVRTRFATPTIGREWMIGREGTAVGAVDPEGIVEVDGARWRARTNRATPIAAGNPLRVAAIDGVTLDVEPLEGAARDYREMRNKSDATSEAPAESAQPT